MYGLEIRQKVISLVAEGHSIESVARFLNISSRTISMWLKKHRNGISLSPNTHHPRQRKLNKEALLDYVKANPDRTLKEIGAVFKVHYSAVHRCLKKLLVTVKKSPSIKSRMSVKEQLLAKK